MDRWQDLGLVLADLGDCPYWDETMSLSERAEQAVADYDVILSKNRRLVGTIAKRIREAQAATREECAQLAQERSRICEDAASKASDSVDARTEMSAALEASHIADKIRQLGKDSTDG